MPDLISTRHNKTGHRLKSRNNVNSYSKSVERLPDLISIRLEIRKDIEKKQSHKFGLTHIYQHTLTDLEAIITCGDTTKSSSRSHFSSRENSYKNRDNLYLNRENRDSLTMLNPHLTYVYNYQTQSVHDVRTTLLQRRFNVYTTSFRRRMPAGQIFFLLARQMQPALSVL